MRLQCLLHIVNEPLRSGNRRIHLVQRLQSAKNGKNQNRAKAGGKRRFDPQFNGTKSQLTLELHNCGIKIGIGLTVTYLLHWLSHFA